MVAVHDGIDRRHAEKTVAGARNAIELKSVAKEYKAAGGGVFRAVAEVDLEVAEGEFVALVGPSGCGKTTLLRMISALEPPSAGSITIYGEPPERLTRTHRLGIAFQEHALLPWLSVRGNLELPFHIAGRPVDQGKIAMLLELVRLTDFARARPKQLSGGMRQRVAIARALDSRPRGAVARRAVRRVGRGHTASHEHRARAHLAAEPHHHCAGDALGGRGVVPGRPGGDHGHEAGTHCARRHAKVRAPRPN